MFFGFTKFYVIIILLQKRKILFIFNLFTGEDSGGIFIEYCHLFRSFL